MDVKTFAARFYQQLTTEQWDLIDPFLFKIIAEAPVVPLGSESDDVGALRKALTAALKEDT